MMFVAKMNCARFFWQAITRYHFNSTLKFSRVSRIGRGRKTGKDENNRDLVAQPPAPAPSDPSLAWTEVTDKNTGLVYWWNTVTNETTALGAPKPNGPSAVSPMGQQGVMQPQQGGMLSGLGSVMAQGLAFGAGSSIAHNMIGSMFGGHDSSGGGDSSDSGDSWDI